MIRAQRLAPILALGLFAACGKRGDPLPPLRRQPAPVDELRIAQRGRFIELEWVSPRRNADGSNDVRLERAEVLRRVIGEFGDAEPGAEPPAFESEAQVVAEIESAEPGETLTYREAWEEGWGGKTVEYAVRYRNRAGRTSALSSLARLDDVRLLSPPSELEAEAGDGFVTLRWRPGARAEAGEYNVYRRREGEDDPRRPLNEAPIGETEYRDESVAFGERWCYRVRGVSAEGATRESESSEEVCLLPVDTFAPPAPSDVVALPSPGGVLLSWQTVDAPDLAGYRVYRARDEGGPFERLTSDPIPLATYTDRDVEADVVYYYSVSAVDRSEPANESPRSETVSARVSYNQFFAGEPGGGER